MMTKFQCPHCGKQGVSFLRKMCLGPAVPAKCKVCGKEVGVPYTAMLTVIPFIGGILASGYAEPFALKAALWIGGFVVTSIIHICWVPLEPR